MRLLPEFNFPAFNATRAVLARAGHHVFNPADRDVEVGFDPTGMTGHENLAEHGFDLRAALGADTAWICAQAEAICLLPGWENSAGARAKMALAAALGLQAGSLEDFAAGTLHPAGELLSVADGAPHLAPAGATMPVTTAVQVAASPRPVLVEASRVQATATPGEVRVTSSTGAQKGSKIARYDLVPAALLWELATLYGVGAGKYADRNWEAGYPLSLSFAALNRHLWSWWNGEDVDPEMGVSHLTNVAWHAFTLRQLLATTPQFDDRPARLILPTPTPTLVRPDRAEAA
jgi:hypothetical protein